MKALFRKFADRSRSHFDQAKVSSLVTRAGGTVRVGRTVLAEAKGAQLRGEHHGFRMTSLALGALIEGRFGRLSLARAEQNARDCLARRLAVTQAQAQIRRQASQVMQGVSLLDSALKSWPADDGLSRMDARMSENLALLTRRADTAIALLSDAARHLDEILRHPEQPLPEAGELFEQVAADLEKLKEQVGWDAPSMMVLS